MSGQKIRVAIIGRLGLSKWPQPHSYHAGLDVCLPDLKRRETVSYRERWKSGNYQIRQPSYVSSYANVRASIGLLHYIRRHD